MKIEEILHGTDYIADDPEKDLRVTSLCFDSREAVAGSMFFAVRGTVVDGHDYIDKAVANGAVAIVAEVLPESRNECTVYIEVADSATALAIAAGNFFGNPSSKLELVGITGTNGKTTTATLLYDLFRKAGYKCGLISTIFYCIDGKDTVSTHTTPDPIKINSLLAGMVACGCQYCFMEVSSHSIDQERIGGLHFRGGIFTNITHDHLDYHKDFAEYIRVKKKFFDDLPPDAFSLVNIDDRNGQVMVQNTRSAVSTMSVRKGADFTCRIIEQHLDGMELRLNGHDVWVNFIGRFNAYNILSVYGAARLLGLEHEELLRYISALTPVRGRFELVRSPSGTVGIVDYAHTPDALSNVIETINDLRPEGSRLLVIAGCGGDRDPKKRSIMGKIASQGADNAILTSDNPRTEDPLKILEQMSGELSGKNHVVIPDRRQAIRTAVMMAGEKDIILVAGKGHETYQDAGGIKTHFDDREELEKAFGIRDYD